MGAGGSRKVPLLLWIGAVLGIAGVPLAMLPGGFNEFAPIKAVVLATAAAATLLALTLDRAAASILLAVVRRSPVAWAGATAFALALAATVASVAPRASLLGNYPDYRGFASIFAVTAIGAGALVISAYRDTTHWLSRLAGVALLAVSASAVWERTLVSSSQLSWNFVRVGSTLGNSSNLGVFAAVALPVAAGSLLSQSERPLWRVIAAAAAGLGLITLVWTSSRGAWLGLLAGGTAWIAIAVARRSGRRLAYVLGAAALVLALVATGVLLTPRASIRLGSIAEVSSRSVQTRLSTWRSSARMVADRPILGVGASAFAVAFPRYRERGQDDGKQGYQVTEAAHNLLWDSATSAGIPGAIALFALVASVVVGVSRWSRAGAETLEIASISAALTAALVALQFHYVTMDTGPLIAALIGVVAAHEPTTSGIRSELARGGRPLGRRVVTATRVGLGIATAVAFLSAAFFVGVLFADLTLAGAASRLEFDAPWREVEADVQSAVGAASADPFASRAGLRLATQSILATADRDAGAYGARAAVAVQSAEADDPLAWQEIGEFWLAADALPGASTLTYSRSAFARAAALDPNNGVPRIGLAEVSLQAGQYAASAVMARSALGLSPRYAHGWQVLARAYKAQGESAAAAEAMRRADLFRGD